MHRIRMTVAGLLVGLAGLSGGCMDAVGRGIADGITEGLSTAVSALIEQTLSGIGGGA